MFIALEMLRYTHIGKFDNLCSCWKKLICLNNSVFGCTQGTKGMQWSNLNDEKNGMKTVLIILAVEAIVFMLLTLYLDQVVASGGGIRKHPLFFLNFKRKDKSIGSTLASSGSNSRKISGSSKSLSHMAVEDKKAVKRQDVEREVSHILLNIFIIFFFF